MKHRLALQAISIMLMAALLVEGVPLVSSAAGANAATATLTSTAAATGVTPDNASDNAEVVGELANLRTAATATYRLANGNCVLAQYDAPVYHKDNTGAYQPVDDTLQRMTNTGVSGGAVWATKDNPVKIAFSAALDSTKLVSIQNGNYTLG